MLRKRVFGSELYFVPHPLYGGAETNDRPQGPEPYTTSVSHQRRKQEPGRVRSMPTPREPVRFNREQNGEHQERESETDPMPDLAIQPRARHDHRNDFCLRPPLRRLYG